MSITTDIQSKGFNYEEEKVIVNLIFTSSLFQREFEKFLKPFSISQVQYNVLRILRGQNKTKILIGDVQSRLLHKESNITRIVKKLVDRGFVEKIQSVEDKRMFYLIITDIGLDFLSTLDPLVQECNKRLILLHKNDINKLNVILDRMRDLYLNS